MKKIDISTPKYPNMFAFVDDIAYERFSKFKWSASKEGTGLYYAVRNDWYDGKSHIVYMHKEILVAKKGYEIDHRNGNGLDNTRSNLQYLTHKQNIRKAKLSKRNKSGYKGVRWNTACRKWRARIVVNGKTIHLGLFTCLIKAAEAYDKAAIKYYGKHANLNSPRKGV